MTFVFWYFSPSKSHATTGPKALISLRYTTIYLYSLVTRHSSLYNYRTWCLYLHGWMCYIYICYAFLITYIYLTRVLVHMLYGQVIHDLANNTMPCQPCNFISDSICISIYACILSHVYVCMGLARLVVSKNRNINCLLLNIYMHMWLHI